MGHQAGRVMVGMDEIHLINHPTLECRGTKWWRRSSNATRTWWSFDTVDTLVVVIVVVVLLAVVLLAVVFLAVVLLQSIWR